MPATLPVVFSSLGAVVETSTPSDKNVDDFEWPEFIDG